MFLPSLILSSGNEKANQVAKEGAATFFVWPKLFCGVGNNLVRQRIKEQEYKMAANRWASLPGHREAKSLLATNIAREPNN